MVYYAPMKSFLLALLLFPALLGAVPCLTLGFTDPPPETVTTHRCISLALGTRRTPEPTAVTYNGLLLGLSHISMSAMDVSRMFIDERCTINGASIQLLAQANVGTLNGLSLTGLLAEQGSMRGIQLTGLANRADSLAGAQLALAMNFTDQRCAGIQFGLLNFAGDLCGLQIGLINVNKAGWTLPLINFSF